MTEIADQVAGFDRGRGWQHIDRVLAVGLGAGGGQLCLVGIQSFCVGRNALPADDLGDDEIALFVGIFGAKPQLGAAWRIAD
ncbi:hypothetical protein, partial [Xanthomonas oryzae]|uniref:hypothetical protein n=1 Tax=Xanthomonas oryzae TaxID=347 RepID=UPI001ED9C168